MTMGRTVLTLFALTFIGCSDDNASPGPGAGGAGSLPEASIDSTVDVSRATDSSDERNAASDADASSQPDADADATARPDTRVDSTAADVIVDSPADFGETSIADGRADVPEVIRPDGGPVTGPGCGGCFADELQAGGRCITNTSCGNPPGAMTRVVNGICQIEACYPGWGDCNGRVDDGCEKDLTRPESCNGCNNVCPSGQFCGASGCMPACPAPLTDCGGTCVDISTSTLHCGACFQACVEKRWRRPVCTAGVCGDEIACGTGSVACGGVCSVLDEDPANCGSCGRACTPPSSGTISCRSGVCIPHCPVGFALCGNSCVDQQTDPAHCGSCGNACAMGSCVAGACDTSWSPVVATGMSPSALALDDTSLYWIETQAGRVMKVAKNGGTPVALATGQQSPFDLALDATNVYWSSRLANAIRRIAKSGGTSPQLVVTANRPMHIATDGTVVYFEQAPPGIDGGSPTDAAPPVDAGFPAPPIVRKTQIGSGMAEDFFQYPDGDTDATLTRMLVDDRFLYWAGRKGRAPGTNYTFMVEKDTGNAARALPTIWGELALDEAFVYITTGSGAVGSLLTVGSFTKDSSRGFGLMQFDPGANYAGGASMAVGSTYVYRSSPGALTGVHKFLKCGTQNAPAKIAATDQWSSLVADATYVYGIFGNEIRRAPH